MHHSEIPWTFKTWIANFKEVDLPIGDLANSILNDEDFPDDDDIPGLIDYIQRVSYCNRLGSSSAVMDTLITSWNFYKLSS